MSRSIRLILVLILVVPLVGCGTSRFSLTEAGPPVDFACDEDSPCDGDGFVNGQFERGRPNRLVDGLGWVIGLPSRITLWNRGVNNHAVSLRTEERLREYVAAHDLDDVKVRIDQYEPLGEWRRLRENDRMGAGWRYTFGVVDTLVHTLLPGRLFGGDRYSPYTNTIHVHSDVPSLALHAAAHARDVRRRRRPGTYSAVNTIPGVHLWHETIATRDTLDWVHATADLDERREAVHVLYPRYGASAGAPIDTAVLAGGGQLAIGGVPGLTGPFGLGGLLVGHARARWQTRDWQDE